VLRLGLTGGIGAGKSTAARRLADLGAVLVDADRLAREVVEPGSDGLAEVVQAFGEQVLTADGALDRAALGRRVFADDAVRLRLNAVLHPRIAALTAQRMAAAGRDAIVVHDVPLLVENRMGAAYHLVLVVHADAEERIRRLVTDRGMAEVDARARVGAQADDDARRAAADVWLDNSGAPAGLLAAVDGLWSTRLVPFADNLRHRRPATVAPQDGSLALLLDAAAVERLRGRLRHALGEACLAVEPSGAPSAGGGAFVVTLPDSEAVDAARHRLADAGFIEVPEGAPGNPVCRAADPGLPVILRLRAVAAGR